MRHQQQLATELLERVGEGSIRGSGVRWRLVAERAPRTCEVDCEFFGETSKALDRGETRGNTHLSVRTEPRRVPPGPEFSLRVGQGDVTRAEGRTAEIEAAAGAARAWLNGAATEDLRASFPFVGQEERARDALQDFVADAIPSARWIAHAGPHRWVSAGDRSIRLLIEGTGVGIAFLARDLQLASGAFDDLPRACRSVQRWLGEGADLAGLACAPEVVVHPHGALFEDGRYSQWSWAHHLDAARTGRSDALCHHLPLLERIVASHCVTRYFAYTSLNRICFSRSSHHPFDTAGLPTISPRRGGGWVVAWGEERHEGGVDAVMGLLEQRLSATAETYLGHRDEALVPTLRRALAATTLEVTGGTARPEERVVVSSSDGHRRCVVHADLSGLPGRLLFHEGDRRVGEAVATGLDEAVDLLLDWLDAGMNLSDLAASASDWRGLGRRRTEPGATRPATPRS